MSKLLRMTSLAATVAALTLTAAPAAAAPVGASTPAKASARIYKPLTLTATRSLDFGTIVVASVNVAGEAVSMNSAGTVTCGTSGGLTCSGSPVTAAYNVTGTNNAVVRIFSAATPLTNANDGSTLSFTPSAPASVTMPNSGTGGANFNVAGSITIVPATTDGLYSGDINVTVDY